MINADTIFNYKILNNLMLSKDNISVAVDDYIESPLDDDAMKVTIKKEQLLIFVRIYQKKIPWVMQLAFIDF